MSPKGVSRQVKPKHGKTKKLHQRPTRQQKLGGTRSERVHKARTGSLPHLHQACGCPCPATPATAVVPPLPAVSVVEPTVPATAPSGESLTTAPSPVMNPGMN